MMKKLLFIFIVFFILAFISNIILACYIYYPIDELAEKSDIILIGKLKENLGHDKIDKSLRLTNWDIDVLYYIKGELNQQQLIVSTPGVRSKGMVTSTDYYLDEWNSDILLLFLYKDDNFYKPISPQGVIGLSEKSNSIILNNDSNGENILQKYNLSDKYISEQDKINLITFINKSQISMPLLDGNNEFEVYARNSSIKYSNFNKYSLYIGSGILLFTFIIYKRIKKKQYK